MQAIREHDVRICGVGPKTGNPRVGLYSQDAFLPRRAAVTRALDGAALPRDEIAVGDEDDIRIARPNCHAAAIGNGVALGEARKAVQRPTLAFVGASPKAIRRSGENFGESFRATAEPYRE